MVPTDGLSRMHLQTPSGKAIEMTTVASSYHIEINPGEAGMYDRYIVQDIIKEIAQNSPLDKSFKGGHCCFHFVSSVLWDVT